MEQPTRGSLQLGGRWQGQHAQPQPQELPVSLSHLLNRARVSDTSNVHQHDVGTSLGLYLGAFRAKASNNSQITA